MSDEPFIIINGFRWEWCNHCKGAYILCSKCSNNCCNGSTGKLPNGANCSCEDAYAEQKKHYDNDTAPRKKDIIKDETIFKRLKRFVNELRNEEWKVSWVWSNAKHSWWRSR